MFASVIWVPGSTFVNTRHIPRRGMSRPFVTKTLGLEDLVIFGCGGPTRNIFSEIKELYRNKLSRNVSLMELIRIYANKKFNMAATSHWIL
jgi:hypothetical protein